MEKVKIKRIQRNKKPITTREKVLAGIGVGAAVLGGAGAVSSKSSTQAMIRTQENEQNSFTSKARVVVTKIFGLVFSPGVAHAEELNNQIISNAVADASVSSQADTAHILTVDDLDGKAVNIPDGLLTVDNLGNNGDKLLSLEEISNGEKTSDLQIVQTPIPTPEFLATPMPGDLGHDAHMIDDSGENDKAFVAEQTLTPTPAPTPAPENLSPRDPQFLAAPMSDGAVLTVDDLNQTEQTGQLKTDGLENTDQTGLLRTTDLDQTVKNDDKLLSVDDLHQESSSLLKTNEVTKTDKEDLLKLPDLTSAPKDVLLKMEDFNTDSSRLLKVDDTKSKVEDTGLLRAGDIKNADSANLLKINNVNQGIKDTGLLTVDGFSSDNQLATTDQVNSGGKLLSVDGQDSGGGLLKAFDITQNDKLLSLNDIKRTDMGGALLKADDVKVKNDSSILKITDINQTIKDQGLLKFDDMAKVAIDKSVATAPITIGSRTYFTQSASVQENNSQQQNNSTHGLTFGQVNTLGAVDTHPFQDSQIPTGNSVSGSRLSAGQGLKIPAGNLAPQNNSSGLMQMPAASQTPATGLQISQNYLAPSGQVSEDNTQKNYTVKKGDTLWNIAKQVYGDGAKWRKVLNANPKVLATAGDTKTLKVNAVLVIP